MSEVVARWVGAPVTLKARRVLLDLLGYGLASAAALALDVSVLMFCYRALGINHLESAAFGFLSGLALIYMLSARYVFQGRRQLGARAEIAGFVATGLAGLVLTEALMHLLVDRLGLAVALSKAATSGAVFLFNFTARRALFSAAKDP